MYPTEKWGGGRIKDILYCGFGYWNRISPPASTLSVVSGNGNTTTELSQSVGTISGTYVKITVTLAPLLEIDAIVSGTYYVYKNLSGTVTTETVKVTASSASPAIIGKMTPQTGQIALMYAIKIG